MNSKVWKKPQINPITFSWRKLNTPTWQSRFFVIKVNVLCTYAIYFFNSNHFPKFPVTMHIKTQIPAFQCVNSGHLERWRRFESTIFCSEQGGTNNLTMLQGLRLCYMKAGWPNEIVKNGPKCSPNHYFSQNECITFTVKRSSSKYDGLLQ
jgi:hypothetical protein